MELLKSSKKRRSAVSELLYVLLNLALVGATLGLILVTESPMAAIGLVFLSKWRVLAVRPRYWMAHIASNLVDVIVGISFVALIYIAGTTSSPVESHLLTQITLSVLYALWLLFLKPRSKRLYMVIQAGLAVFLGSTTLYMVTYDLPSIVVVAGMWLIGYAGVRHVLETYHEPHQSFYSFLGGFLFAQLGWLFYHWTFAYPIPGTGLAVAQASVVFVLVGFLMVKAYDSFFHHQKIRLSDILLPSLLTVSVTIVLLVGFNTPGSGL